MREIFIKYNPYRLKTEITIDGDEPRQNSKLNFGEKRLQEWVENLPDILVEECGTKEFKLVFNGTVLDYEDIEAMAKDAKKKGISFELEWIPAKEVKDKEQAISDIFDEIKNGPFDELKQKDVIRAFNMAKSSDFEVNVIATMSAGKSTLINSLLRCKLMPAKQEACTATITEIKDNDADNFTAKVYDASGSEIQTYSELTLEIMDQLNADPKVSKIRIEGNIPFVTADDVSLVLVDTPGPNNSRDPEHKAATFRMLSESSKTVVLYILNATQLAVTDDSSLLNHVADSMRVGGKQSRDRFIFVVNKLDDFRAGEDSVESAIKKVRDYLKDNGIENANIYPASALTALNIRTVLAKSDDDDDDEVYEAKGKVRKFNKHEEMHFEKYAPLTPSAKEKVEKMLAEAKEKEDINDEALIHSGIVPIEMAIRMYVQKYAKTAKIKNIVDTFSKKLESAKSFERKKQEITENEDKKAEILESISNINKKLASGDEAKKFKEQIEKSNYDSEIKEIANSIGIYAQERITDQLKSTNDKMTVEAAKNMCRQFEKFTVTLQAEMKVKFDDLIKGTISKNASKLLKEYKKKIAELVQDVSVSDIVIDPIEIMKGEISGAEYLINDYEREEDEVVDTKWVENTDKAWYKPWTWLDAKGQWEDIIEKRTYVDGRRLADSFFSPIEDQMWKNTESAVEYAKVQTKKIKSEFSKKFDELDKVLQKKLKELEKCATDKNDIEKRINDAQAKLDWLLNIQEKINGILDI